MTNSLPQWLQETIATDIDETGEISDSSKEAVAAQADADLESCSLASLFAGFDAFVATRSYLD